MNDSHVRGATDVELINDTIGVCFDRVCVRHAHNEALVVAHQDVRWSWREFKRRVDNLAVGLLRLGLVARGPHWHLVADHRGRNEEGRQAPWESL
jgi:fatty-acyl-CoA synthase